MSSVNTNSQDATNAIVAAGGKFIQTKDGRIVEYSVHEPASASADTSLVMVTAYVADYLLGKPDPLYKTISLSLPGLGHSDPHLGHDISKWPETDLLPILQSEGVQDEFIMWGDSLGTQYAIAAAEFFGERVAALGLRVPFLPRHISVPHNLPQGQPTLPCSNDVANNTLSARITRWVIHRVTRWITHSAGWSSWLMLRGVLGRNMKSMALYMREYPQGAKELRALMQHFGPQAMLCVAAEDVILDSTVDIRKAHAAQQGKLVVWYALDDDDCPPSHGKWIVDNLTCYHHRAMEGYGHVGGAFIDMDQFLAKLMECAGS